MRAASLASVCLLLLAGCARPLAGEALTIQGAVQPNLAAGQVDIRVTRPFADGMLVFYLLRAGVSGPQPSAYCVVHVRRSWFLWHADGGGGCLPIQQGLALQSFHPFGFGRVTGPQATYTYAEGLALDPAISAVAVTFENGERQVVPIEHGAFLAAIPSRSRVSLYEALDQSGAVLYRR